VYDNPEQTLCPLYKCTLEIAFPDPSGACNSAAACGLSVDAKHPGKFYMETTTPQVTSFKSKCKNYPGTGNNPWRFSKDFKIIIWPPDCSYG